MARANRRLVDGTVDTNDEHIDMFFGGYDEEAIRIARVAPGPVSGEFVVELLVDPTGDDLAAAVAQVRDELTFYLVEKEEDDPWAYARYHCSTASNVYGRVHWALYLAGI